MPKTLLFCADGTWNGPGEDVGELGADSSNVLKLYLSLAGDDVNDATSSYRSADEQEPKLVGFSRGAYTARALGGMVATQGLMDPEQSNLADKDIAYRLGSAVWADYRRHKSAGDPSAAARLESVLSDLPGFFTNAAAIPMVGPISLACIAVWDTVGALGITRHTIATP